MKGSLVQAKVKTSAIAAALASMLGDSVFGGELPGGVADFVVPAIAGVITLGIGWITKNTPEDLLQIEQQKVKRQ